MLQAGICHRLSRPPVGRFFGRSTAALIAASLLVLATVGAEAAPRAAGSTIAIADRMPAVRPEFPVPTDPNMIFYIQRSTNPNTVVYTANLRSDGKLDPKEPVKAF